MAARPAAAPACVSRASSAWLNVRAPSISRVAAKAEVGPTYHKDVLPILQTHCQVCHRPGEAGPFALMTYKQAVVWADDVKHYTGDRTMPPWKARAGKEFIGDRRMSEKEIDTLAKWADANCPEGTRCIDEQGGVCAFTCSADPGCDFLGPRYDCKDRDAHGQGRGPGEPAGDDTGPIVEDGDEGVHGLPEQRLPFYGHCRPGSSFGTVTSTCRARCPRTGCRCRGCSPSA